MDLSAAWTQEHLLDARLREGQVEVERACEWKRMSEPKRGACQSGQWAKIVGESTGGSQLAKKGGLGSGAFCL